MERERSLRIGAAVIVCAILLRLTAGGFFDPLARLLEKPEVVSVLLYLETGRVVRPAVATVPEIVKATEPVVPEAPAGPAVAPGKASFSPDDAALVTLKYDFSYTADVEALLQTPLDWDLAEDGPTVLILHTHATESYTKAGEDYEESAAYRTLDEAYNMVSIGDCLAEALEAGGIRVVHDRTLHDYPSYNGSYENSRRTAENWLETYPGIRLILDIHRDAAEDENGNQFAASVQVEGRQAAQIMLVLGSDAGGLTHPGWRENLALAVKLQAVLERRYPGLCRPIHLTTQRYNQDLSPGALLVEIGAAGNTREEALLGAQALAQGILDLSAGTE